MFSLKMSSDKKITAKEKILTTAHDLFYSLGIRATGIDKIIQQAKVTKVTFYRHYPSKSSLIIAYLNYRHKIWSNWFYVTLRNKLDENKAPSYALSETFHEWFLHPSFRGCAFMNATAEAEAEDIRDEIKSICRNHKFETRKIIATLIDMTEYKLTDDIMMLIDGAIIHAQMGIDVNEVVEQLNNGLKKLLLAV
ncbi:TetR/AcrR family transcriptional regulator [Buttiauxella sp. A2-C1_F]|uniref:TetR/AcrR family transcriptional regulator n=1 Tax=unclassified Buttiauxella TaxID=2634062 RepID=UPI001E549476|nr:MULTISPECIES: TetR/AcrR family transcriptional regulator [unclassified Buttiauxella]MCE0800471.1 TetR/AcrR family transcriptional regulator [Buttiauxella sp. W03-F01]MCE0846501.1 TetR/AcrR family transcriptional regulator [Buttiauxella sp. A2-C1_F]